MLLFKENPWLVFAEEKLKYFVHVCFKLLKKSPGDQIGDIGWQLTNNVSEFCGLPLVFGDLARLPVVV